MITRIRTNIAPVIESIPRAVSMWANLLAISAVITLTGLIEINVEPTIQLLKPTYIIQKQDLKRILLGYKYPLTDSLINSIFDSKTVIVVDVPHPNAILLKSGEVITGVVHSPDGKRFQYKELTDGSKIFRSAHAGYAPDSELKGEKSFQKEDELMLTPQSELSLKNKKIQVMPFFSHLLMNNFGMNWKYLTTDSLLKIEQVFDSYGTDPPSLLSPAVFQSRRVYSILSIENYEEYDVKDLQLRVFKKFSLADDDNLRFEAWTLGESILNYNHLFGKELMIQIPNLRANSDIQLIVSNWFLEIKNEDIIHTYGKLKSINESYVWFIVIATLILSIACRVAIQFLKL